MTRTLVFLALLGLTSCAALMSASIPAKSDQRELFDPAIPAQAYTKAVRATMAVGGTIRSQDSTSGAVSATVQQVVNLNVSVQPEGQGSKVVVHAQVPPGHVTTGDFTLINDWIRAYQHQL